MTDHDEAPLTHISSAVVRVREERRDDVVRRILALPGTEVPFAEGSKIIVVMETADGRAAGRHLERIAAWPGVLAASLVFEQAESADSLGEAL